jgi:hypothetical protein
MAREGLRSQRNPEHHAEDVDQEQPTQPAKRQRTTALRKSVGQPHRVISVAAKKSAQKFVPPAEEEYQESDEEDEEYNSRFLAKLSREEEDEQEEEQEDEDDEVGTANQLLEIPEVRDGIAKILQRGLAELQRQTRTRRRRSNNVRAPREPSPPAELPLPTVHAPKERRMRKPRNPWTLEEEAFLIDRIAKHGCKWAAFAKKYKDDRLKDRDQTALKDKARNIRLRWIEEGVEEEMINRFPNWAYVTVGSQRRGVHRLEEQGLTQEERDRLAYLSD